MVCGGRTAMCIKLIVVGLAGSSSAMADGFCCFSAPKTWQYHRDVCFGHYQTRWRRWDEVCGSQPQTIPVSPVPVASTGGSQQKVPRSKSVVDQAASSPKMNSTGLAGGESTVELAVPMKPIESEISLNRTPVNNPTSAPPANVIGYSPKLGLPKL
jgi:hypothetical protein